MTSAIKQKLDNDVIKKMVKERNKVLGQIYRKQDRDQGRAWAWEWEWEWAWA